MFVKQIDLKEALKLTEKGQEVMVMAPNVPDPRQWNDYYPDTLQGMLSGCMFFRREPAMADPEFEVAVGEMEGMGSPNAGAGAGRGAAKPAGQSKRKKVDTGKILALHRANWSNVKIAGEMGISDVTVGKYLKQMKGEGQDEGKDKVQ